MRAGSRLLILVSALASGCGQPAGGPGPASAQPSITVAGNELVYVGPITREAVARVREALSANTLSGLRIDSGGGDVEAGMEIGALIRDRQLDVRVRGACLSSCANYVFPSGRNKFILPGGIVAWHGSPAHLHHQDRRGAGSPDPAIRQFNAQLSRRDAEFMRSIGVDPRVSWFGKLPPFSVPNFYALTTADMEAFGIKAVTAPTGYGPGYLDALPDGLRQGIVFIQAEPAR